MTMLIETFAVGPFGCNCSVLADPATRQAVIVDPGGDAERIAALVRHHDLSVVAIVHTHAHLDHIYCTREVKEAHGGAIALHRDDLFLYDGLAMQAALVGWEPRTVLPVDRFLGDGDEVLFGASRLRALHTPGHTPGSLCFELATGERTVIFAGDTLFRRSIGRTDLPGGDGQLILRSIREKLYTRDPDAVVVPGHGPPTTIAEEAAGNPFVRS